MKKVDHCPEGYKPFKCANGKIYFAPVNCCFFCKHCTDIIYDYTNGPYMHYCDIEEEPYEHFVNCENFKEG